MVDQLHHSYRVKTTLRRSWHLEVVKVSYQQSEALAIVFLGCGTELLDLHMAEQVMERDWFGI